MVQIQIDFTDEEDHQIDIYRATERLENKKDAVIKIIREKFKIRGDRKI